MFAGIALAGGEGEKEETSVGIAPSFLVKVINAAHAAKAGEIAEIEKEKTLVSVDVLATDGHKSKASVDAATCKVLGDSPKIGLN